MYEDHDGVVLHHDNMIVDIQVVCCSATVTSEVHVVGCEWSTHMELHNVYYCTYCVGSHSQVVTSAII